MIHINNIVNTTQYTYGSALNIFNVNICSPQAFANTRRRLFANFSLIQRGILFPKKALSLNSAILLRLLPSTKVITSSLFVTIRGCGTVTSGTLIFKPWCIASMLRASRRKSNSFPICLCSSIIAERRSIFKSVFCKNSASFRRFRKSFRISFSAPGNWILTATFWPV